jgi:hypothetical protein
MDYQSYTKNGLFTLREASNLPVIVDGRIRKGGSYIFHFDKSQGIELLLPKDKNVKRKVIAASKISGIEVTIKGLYNSEIHSVGLDEDPYFYPHRLLTVKQITLSYQGQSLHLHNVYQRIGLIGRYQLILPEEGRLSKVTLDGALSELPVGRLSIEENQEALL